MPSSTIVPQGLFPRERFPTPSGPPGRARSRAARGGRGRARSRPGARGGRHRQDPRDHPPHRPRRRHGHLRADRGPRGHLHHPCRRRDARPPPAPRRPRRPGAHVPQRGPAPAPLVLADDVRRRAADADRVEARDGRRGRPPAARPDRPGAPARPRLRDRVGQGQQRRPRRLRRGRRPTRPGGQRRRPRDRRPAVRRLRGGQALPGPDGHGGRPAPDRRDARRGGACRRPGPRAVQVVRRRRVPGRLADPVGAARPLARRARRDLRRGRPRPDHLLLRGRRRVVPPRLPAQVRRHHLRRALPQLPLLARGGRRGERRPGRLGIRPRYACAPSVRAARRCATPRRPTRWPRPTP